MKGCLFLLFLRFFIVIGANEGMLQPFSGDYYSEMMKMERISSFRSLREGNAVRQNVYDVTSYGADPSGKNDSTAALLQAISDAAKGFSDGFLMHGITNLGGAMIHLQGGTYLISQPLRFPVSGIGNLVISGGTLRASNRFPSNGYLIDFDSPASSSSSAPYSYEFITLRDLMFDCNYMGGGVSVVKSLRTTIENCYIAHFSSNGIFVKDGHETFIRTSFIGQHVTAGGDTGERNFTGTGIYLAGNDNAVTDTVIFSGGTGIMVTGEANTFSGVHCYNKATGFKGVGIYLRLRGLTQTRIINCYMDYTGIVAEDPVQLTVTNSFFLGDAFVLLKSVSGIASGVTIVNNMFSGSDAGVDIVKAEAFKRIEHVVVENNSARGMNVRATSARGSATGNGTLWRFDFRSELLFGDMMSQVFYSMKPDGHLFPNHRLGSTFNNQVLVQTDIPVSATVFVNVHQLPSV